MLVLSPHWTIDHARSQNHASERPDEQGEAKSGHDGQIEILKSSDEGPLFCGWKRFHNFQSLSWGNNVNRGRALQADRRASLLRRLIVAVEDHRFPLPSILQIQRGSYGLERLLHGFLFERGVQVIDFTWLDLSLNGDVVPAL